MEVIKNDSYNNIKIMKYLYKALVDFPAFGIRAGMTYSDEQMTIEQKSIKDVNTIFEKVRVTVNELHAGDMVLASGLFVNTKIQKRNKHCIPNTHILGEDIYNMVAEILDIEENAHGTGLWGVKLKGANGCIYWAYTKTLDRTKHSNPCAGRYITRLMSGKVYFYISSSGCICRTVLGKDKYADQFRDKTGNRFDTHDKAYMVYQAIMRGDNGISLAIFDILKNCKFEKGK